MYFLLHKLFPSVRCQEMRDVKFILMKAELLAALHSLFMHCSPFAMLNLLKFSVWKTFKSTDLIVSGCSDCRWGGEGLIFVFATTREKKTVSFIMTMQDFIYCEHRSCRIVCALHTPGRTLCRWMCISLRHWRMCFVMVIQLHFQNVKVLSSRVFCWRCTSLL